MILFSHESFSLKATQAIALAGVFFLCVFSGCASRQKTGLATSPVEEKLAQPQLKPKTKPSSPALESVPPSRAMSAASTDSSIPASSARVTSRPQQTPQTFQTKPKPKPSTAQVPVREVTVFEKPGDRPRQNSLYEDSIALSKVRRNLKSVPGWNVKHSSKITLRRGTVTLRVPNDMSQKEIQAAAKAALQVNEVGRVEILRN